MLLEEQPEAVIEAQLADLDCPRLLASALILVDLILHTLPALDVLGALGLAEKADVLRVHPVQLLDGLQYELEFDEGRKQ